MSVFRSSPRPSLDTAGKPQKRCRRVGYAALPHQIPVDAFRQDAAHVRAGPQIRAVHGLSQQAIQHATALRVLPQIGRGQVFQRPREQRVFQSLEHELRFRIWQGHRFFRGGMGR